jgi:transposase
MSEKQQRRRFDAQFKLDALRLIQESNRKISDIARELGIRPELLYRWKSEHTADPEQAFPGKGHMKPDEEYVRRLERELAQARSERDILKKALAYFSKNER